MPCLTNDSTESQMFTTPAQFLELLKQAPATDVAAIAAAAERNGQLTKPPGALGRLEDLAQWYAGWRGDARPIIQAPQIVIFAGNHGVCAQGVSAFPPEVTEQMVLNFRAGGAAINQLSRAFGATLDVHALDLDRPTADFTQGPAMDEQDFVAALKTGWEAVRPDADVLVTGEMGIGNTTSAAAVATALFGGDAANWTGRGTGVDDEGLKAKTAAVRAGLEANPGRDGLEVLRCLGGRELVAMAGAIAAARAHRIPVILDGFICCAAAACLQASVPGALVHCVAGHQSAEAAHPEMLAMMGLKPLLQLEMRLGEGSGAAVALSVLHAALACHSGMSTFAEAGVAKG